jgi:predicted AAA+ superfamily ATPase
MFTRILEFPGDDSFFLFGARGTGKSTWLAHHFRDIPHVAINLLQPEVEEKFARSPQELRFIVESLPDQTRWVLVDEIQKVPKLLDVVHFCMEKFHVRFAMTGSSARKLRRGAANLLAGRAFVFNLFPLTHVEIGEDFDLQEALQWGTLPQRYRYTTDQSRSRYLRTYGRTYLKEEIVAEQVVRKLDPFRQFLEIAAQSNGEIINYSNIARDIGVDVVTVQSYFQILDDTLVGYLLYPYHQSVRKRQRTNPKFYFFDLGVKRSLENTLSIPLQENTYAYGKAFEHFVILELVRLNHYYETDYTFSYLRTKDQAEIDLIVERPGRPPLLVEIKSSRQVDERHVRNLRHFLPAFPSATAWVISCDSVSKKIKDVPCFHWSEGIRQIFLPRAS